MPAPPGDPRTAPPVAGAVGLLGTGPIPVPVAAPAVVTTTDPALLPVLAPRPARAPSLVQRVALLLHRLGGAQGRHRTGTSRHGWSMFAPHPAARRRSGWGRR